MMVHDTGHPIAFHIDAIGHIEEFEGATREGVWWLPNDTTKDILILTNQGSKQLGLELSIYDAHGKEAKKHIDLDARQTGRYSIRELVNAGGLIGSYGGLQIRALAHAGSLDTLHAVYDEGAGFSALLKMFDRDPSAKIQARDFAHTARVDFARPDAGVVESRPRPELPQRHCLRATAFHSKHYCTTARCAPKIQLAEG
jgi:hypothetical protein